ncbi:hypothetical protein AB0943_01325 [Streptomyces sp. NPDC007044]|uniref:hypothetical protein n=1 Tax=Streptomyces sp. NPDC007044 TaxID=3156911 RepID=UPI00345231C0
MRLDRRRPPPARRIEQGMCPDHGAAADRSGACPGCEDDRVPRHAVQIVPGGLDNLPRGACCNRGARIFLTGAAVFDGRSKSPSPNGPACDRDAGRAVAGVTQPVARRSQGSGLLVVGLATGAPVQRADQDLGSDQANVA